MSRKTIRIVITLVVLAFLVVFLVLKFYIFRNAETSVASKKADITLNSGDLVKSFETDEKGSDTKYLNKIILVKGVVDNVAENKADVSVYLKDKDATSGVMCSFDKTEFAKNKVKAGDQIGIKGICSGYLLDVVLNKCSIEK